MYSSLQTGSKLISSLLTLYPIQKYFILFFVSNMYSLKVSTANFLLHDTGLVYRREQCNTAARGLVSFFPVRILSLLCLPLLFAFQVLT